MGDPEILRHLGPPPVFAHVCTLSRSKSQPQVDLGFTFHSSHVLHSSQPSCLRSLHCLVVTSPSQRVGRGVSRLSLVQQAFLQSKKRLQKLQFSSRNFGVLTRSLQSGTHVSGVRIFSEFGRLTVGLSITPHVGRDCSLLARYSSATGPDRFTGASTVFVSPTDTFFVC